MSTNLRASIDIGSNSILLLVVDASDNFKVLANESNVTGLGRDLDKNGYFIQEAMDESYEVLKSYASQCQSLGVDTKDIMVTATEASRVSRNAKEFFDKILSDIGLIVRTISGEGEAYYSATGVLYDQTLQDEIITIMDIGGASTELIQVERKTKNILTSFSMPVGVVRMNNWREDREYESRIDKIFSDYSHQLEKVLTNKLICVAGTMTSVGNMFLKLDSFIEEEVNGLDIIRSDVQAMLINFKEYTAEDFLKKFPFLGKRSKTIYSGLMLADRIFDRLGVRDIYISTYGLRYGTILANSIKDEYVWKRD